MLPYMFAFAAVASGVEAVQRRQAECSSTITLDTLSVTTVQPISVYILAGQLAPTGGANNEPFTTIVYQTVYSTFCPDCPNGLQPQTYTVTQTCTGSIASCRPLGNVLPQGFTTTQATCTNCPTPFSAVLTVPHPTDAPVTRTALETVTEGGLTSTRTVVSTYASQSPLPGISATGRVQTIDRGVFAQPFDDATTVTRTEQRTAYETATVTRDATGGIRPVGLNSGAGRLVSSDKMMAFGMSALVLLLLA
ncbi:hypothetical protein LX36DRAFT_661649, partial [Colletotrichum falcatum]